MKYTWTLAQKLAPNAQDHYEEATFFMLPQTDVELSVSPPRHLICHKKASGASPVNTPIIHLFYVFNSMTVKSLRIDSLEV
jgi:hypothetical protein